MKGQRSRSLKEEMQGVLRPWAEFRASPAGDGSPPPPPHPRFSGRSFLHSAVLLQAVRGEAAVGPAAALHTAAAMAQFAASLPALRQRLQEEREGGEQVAEAGQVEGAVVGLRVVVQEACEGQAEEHREGLTICWSISQSS